MKQYSLLHLGLVFILIYGCSKNHKSKYEGQYYFIEQGEYKEIHIDSLGNAELYFGAEGGWYIGTIDADNSILMRGEDTIFDLSISPIWYNANGDTIRIYSIDSLLILNNLRLPNSVHSNFAFRKRVSSLKDSLLNVITDTLKDEFNVYDIEDEIIP